MINDEARNDWYFANMPDCTGLTVVDVGSGIGLLADFALRKGAKKVICLEIDPYLVHCCSSYFREKWPDSDVEILEQDYRTFDFSIADLAIHEQFSSDVFSEGCKNLVQATADKCRLWPTSYGLSFDSLPNDSVTLAPQGFNKFLKDDFHLCNERSSRTEVICADIRDDVEFNLPWVMQGELLVEPVLFGKTDLWFRDGHWKSWVRKIPYTGSYKLVWEQRWKLTDIVR